MDDCSGIDSALAVLDGVGTATDIRDGFKELWRSVNPLVADWSGEGRKEKLDNPVAGRLEGDACRGSSFAIVSVLVSASQLGLCSEYTDRLSLLNYCAF